MVALPFGVTLAASASLPGLSPYTSGFRNPIITTSVGAAATCISGTIPVSASAQNVQLNYPTPANQSVVTETIVEFLQIDTTLPAQVIGPKHTVSGNYNIGAKLCYPIKSGSPNASAIQLLTHDVGFDKSYWDFYSSSYSYQNAAALAGYTTFAYDRLGIGASSSPSLDAIQTIQAPLEISIAHSLIQMLKSGSFANTKFSKIIGVGHSLGSELTNAITAQYPNDFSTAVLTGFSVDASGQPVFFSALDLVIARQNSSFRFPYQSNGYLGSQSLVGNQFAFFRAPKFDPLVLAAAEAAKQTFTIGELFTNSMFVAPAPEFTGGLMVVDGLNDLPFCQSEWLVPNDKLEAVKEVLYPSVGSFKQYVADGVGHGLNLHYGAAKAYQAIFGFLRGEGY